MTVEMKVVKKVENLVEKMVEMKVGMKVEKWDEMKVEKRVVMKVVGLVKKTDSDRAVWMVAL
jgi:hypothetical protein